MSSVSRTRLKAMAQGGNKKAARTLALSENYDRMISTILIGNNVVNILSSSIATVLFVSLLGERYGTGVATTVSTVVMTVLILILGKFPPKSWPRKTPSRWPWLSLRCSASLSR